MKKKTKKSKKDAQRVKLPTLRQMQLGPYKHPDKPNCGCLLFHADRLDGRELRKVTWHDHFDIWKKVVELDHNIDLTLAGPEANTLPNRRKALTMLHRAMRSLGYRISRDKKYATKVTS